ncbi:uncharacterized protein LOC100904331 [Galendromus occidentalis]|uniref:Uncharacterized protein LOC100904331 n=1 Tax=Galendromus occidentalis TaxID=34638 RepID=A0AAJ6QVI7_9ACAR|nr:uncharacterized protein LOC100904331 [Galendromus occidentalis]
MTSIKDPQKLSMKTAIRLFNLTIAPTASLVYRLADTSLLIEDLQKPLNLVKTVSYEECLRTWEGKFADIDDDFFSTRAMTDDTWKGLDRRNRHLLTRFAIHGFHRKKCLSGGYHEPNEICRSWRATDISSFSGYFMDIHECQFIMKPKKIGGVAAVESARGLGERIGRPLEAGSMPRNPDSRSRPNVFIAIPISDPQIHSKVREVQRRFVEALPKAEKYMESTRKHHVTLNLTAIDDDRIGEICALFKEHIKEIVASPALSNFENSQLHLKDIDNFDSQEVIFCKLSATGFDINAVFDKLNDFLKTAKLPLLHRAELSTHVTLFKLRGRRAFSAEDWKKLRKVYHEVKKENIDFGVQPVGEIQLLHMMLPKDHNGYYAELATSLAKKSLLSRESFDELHRECCVLPLGPSSGSS